MWLNFVLSVSKTRTLNSKNSASRVFAISKDKQDNNANIMQLIFFKLNYFGCSMLFGFCVSPF